MQTWYFFLLAATREPSVASRSGGIVYVLQILAWNSQPWSVSNEEGTSLGLGDFTYKRTFTPFTSRGRSGRSSAYSCPSKRLTMRRFAVR